MENAKLVETLYSLLFNAHAVCLAILCGGVTETIRRAGKTLKWARWKWYIILLPLVPELLGMGMSLIPNVVPEEIAEAPVLIHLGFGVAMGMASSKVFKFVKTFGEKPEVEQKPEA